ncbi:MAG TPA: hypothetical protein VL982_09785 [Burkholderiales bacterium]|jgi:hypothetical protein|nr:hypothetical protein [Burkholderiales bacterium]
MRNGILAATLGLGLLTVLGVAACSTDDDATPLVSSARAAAPMEPLYPPLAADAVDGSVHEYY